MKGFTSIVVFKGNLKKRLQYLKSTTGISTRTLSIIADQSPNWLAGIVSEDRNIKRLSVHIVDKVAELVGMPPWELIRPDVDVTWPTPGRTSLRKAHPILNTTQCSILKK
jgi:hypothetical protein